MTRAEILRREQKENDKRAEEEKERKDKMKIDCSKEPEIAIKSTKSFQMLKIFKSVDLKAQSEAEAEAAQNNSAPPGSNWAYMSSAELKRGSSRSGSRVSRRRSSLSNHSGSPTTPGLQGVSFKATPPESPTALSAGGKQGSDADLDATFTPGQSRRKRGSIAFILDMEGVTNCEEEEGEGLESTPKEPPKVTEEASESESSRVPDGPADPLDETRSSAQPVIQFDDTSSPLGTHGGQKQQQEIHNFSMISMAVSEGEFSDASPVQSPCEAAVEQSEQEEDHSDPSSVGLEPHWHWDEEAGYWYSEQEKLYYDAPSGHYYNAESGQWYDPEADKWYVHDEEEA